MKRIMEICVVLLKFEDKINSKLNFEYKITIVENSKRNRKKGKRPFYVLRVILEIERTESKILDPVFREKKDYVKV